MGFTSMEEVHLWAKRLSLFTALLVALLSWRSGVTVGLMLIRSVVAWGVIYALSLASISLFERTAQADTSSRLEHLRGMLMDVAVGDDTGVNLTQGIGIGEGEKMAAQRATGEERIPGQVDPQLTDGLEDAQRQAEIVRRMGWGK